MYGGSESPSVPGPGERPRVLIADDEEALLRVIARTLESAGFDVSTAEDGSTAMKLLAEQRFDAVLTDVVMPGMSGVALLRAVRAQDLEVPVLLMTGAPDVATAADAVHYGASEYMIKPVPIEQLVTTIRRAAALSALARAKRDSMRLLESGRPEAGDRAGLEVTLDRALGSLWMAYQPIVTAATRSLFGYEALLRSGEASLPHPGAVLDAAERLGRLADVGRAVRQRVPEPMPSAPPPAVLFVNLHASDLEDESLTSSSAPLSQMASRVVLEITERASLDAVKNVRSRCAHLRELGFRIAIDDLGAGYAGLTSFAQLEPEFVKLDMTLIRDVHKHPVKKKLVRSMTELCRDLGIVVVAEGIETVAERDTIVELGCELLQGYLLAKPGRPFPEVTW